MTSKVSTTFDKHSNAHEQTHQSLSSGNCQGSNLVKSSNYQTNNQLNQQYFQANRSNNNTIINTTLNDQRHNSQTATFKVNMLPSIKELSDSSIFENLLSTSRIQSAVQQSISKDNLNNQLLIDFLQRIERENQLILQQLLQRQQQPVKQAKQDQQLNAPYFFDQRKNQNNLDSALNLVSGLPLRDKKYKPTILISNQSKLQEEQAICTFRQNQMRDQYGYQQQSYNDSNLQKDLQKSLENFGQCKTLSNQDYVQNINKDNTQQFRKSTNFQSSNEDSTQLQGSSGSPSSSSESNIDENEGKLKKSQERLESQNLKQKHQDLISSVESNQDALSKILPYRRTMEIMKCPHKSQKHYAKGMCNHCYHKYGRNSYADACPHTDRLVYAKGKCQNCYLNDYNKQKRRLNKDKSHSGKRNVQQPSNNLENLEPSQKRIKSSSMLLNI